MVTRMNQPSSDSIRMRVLAATVSLLAGTAIFAAKMVAWHLTGSSAVLSDALESVVNVVAAVFALTAIRVAARPADQDHPYGHGKMEHLSAAFEGGLITLAAGLIMHQAALALWRGVELRALDVGLAVTAGTGVANLLLGLFLLRAGRRLASPTLVADGQHVLSDVWTTAGVLAGLGLVRLTGLPWLDPLAALLVGGLLARTGVRLVREAADGLLDREDPALVERIVRTFEGACPSGMFELHDLRTLRHGAALHIDAHVYVPAHWTVRQAHEALEELQRRAAGAGLPAEFALHLDPCAKACERCSLAPPLRTTCPPQDDFSA